MKFDDSDMLLKLHSEATVTGSQSNEESQA